VTDAPPEGEPPADRRDALIREQAQQIAAQARQIAALEAMVAGSAGAAARSGAGGVTG